MKTYEVKITDHALEQMQETIDYISNQLASPHTARKWISNIKRRISSLSQAPKRIKLINDEPWHSEGIRKMVVNKFLVYFYIDEPLLTVWITAVVYSGMEQTAQLEQINIDN